MGKYILAKILLPLIILMVFWNCSRDPLFDKPLDQISSDIIFTDSVKAEMYVNGAYKHMIYFGSNVTLNGFNILNGGLSGGGNRAPMMESATPNSQHSRIWNVNSSERLTQGSVTPDQQWVYLTGSELSAGAAELQKGCWQTPGGYMGIRAANVGLENIHLLKDGYLKKRMTGELTFIKAMNHFTLFRSYGGVPIADKAFTDKDELQLPRNKVEDLVNYIVETCDKAAALLPVRYIRPDEVFRATKGAALAVKSRTLLFAASALFNGTGIDNSSRTFICYGNSDLERWKRAALAAKEVIDLKDEFGAKAYELYTAEGKVDASGMAISYRNFFKAVNASNKELIFGRLTSNNTSYLEVTNCPPGTNTKAAATGAASNPTQQLVDAYEMIDGTLFNWSDPNLQKDPYGIHGGKKRDPRFYADIIYNKKALTVGTTNVTIETFVGGLNSKNNPNNALNYPSLTGYYMNKFCFFDAWGKPPTNNATGIPRFWPHFRYAEILLNFAEAANEYGGPDANIGGLTATATINELRARVGMPSVATTFANRGVVLNQANMRKLIRNERRMELVYEDHYYWDIRRWMEYKEDYTQGIAIKKDTKVPSGFVYYEDNNKDGVNDKGHICAWKDGRQEDPHPLQALRQARF
jgi:hypothetical protein